MKVKYWLVAFVIFGLYGTVGEIFINFIMTILRGAPLWIYYNGFSTSLESFFLFGLFGCMGFKIYKILNDIKSERFVKKFVSCELD